MLHSGNGSRRCRIESLEARHMLAILWANEFAPNDGNHFNLCLSQRIYL